MTNEGLGVGLASGLGIPLPALMIIFAVTYGRRKHPKLPAPDPSFGKTTTENWLNLYNATRPRSVTEKILSMMEGVGLVRKPVVQEVYVMENGTKISK